MHQVWRLSEYCENNLGVCLTDDGLFLGRTPLIERQRARFAVRGRIAIERLLSRAYGSDLAVDRLLPGLATVTAALNANDPGLARIAAVHLRIPDLPDQAARDRLEAEDVLIRSVDGASAAPASGAAFGDESFLLVPTDGVTKPVPMIQSIPAGRLELREAAADNFAPRIPPNSHKKSKASSPGGHCGLAYSRPCGSVLKGWAI